MKTIDDLIREIDICDDQIRFAKQLEAIVILHIHQVFDSNIQPLIYKQNKLKKELDKIEDREIKLMMEQK